MRRWGWGALINEFVRNHMNSDFSPGWGWGPVYVRQTEVEGRLGDLRRGSPAPAKIIQSG